MCTTSNDYSNEIRDRIHLEAETKPTMLSGIGGRRRRNIILVTYQAIIISWSIRCGVPLYIDV